MESMCNDPDIIAENIQVMMINDKGGLCFIPRMTQINTQYSMENYLIIDLPFVVVHPMGVWLTSFNSK